MGGVSLIEYLNDPHLVARFQRYFGVQAKPKSSMSLQNRENNQNQRVLRSATKKSINSKLPLEKLELDADYEFDTDDTSSETNSINGTADTTTTNRRGWTNHARNESSGSSGVSSGADEDEHPKNLREEDVVSNRFWYYLFQFGTALGDEVFYSFWFSFWFWNVDGAVGRRVVLLWAILMYIGQGLKDIIRMPRPSCPPVIRLEKKWEKEYGMPSTHAVVGAAVPFATIFFTATRYQYPIILGVAGAVTWCSLVCTSRIYLGMHSVLDIVAGLGLVLTLFVPVIPLVDWLDPLILKSEYGGLGLFLCAVVLCLCTPGGDRWTPARGDTFVILGSCVGLMSGGWLNYQMGVIRGPPLDPPYAVIWPSYSMLGLSVLRLIIGLCMILATRAFIKSLLHTFFHTLLKIPKRKDLSGSTKQEVFAELTQKFVSYIVIGICVTCVSPAAFRIMGIERPTFHTEI